jgi:hypothetical protein
MQVCVISQSRIQYLLYIYSDKGIDKLPMDRILPYMSKSEAEKLDMDDILSHSSDDSLKNMQWEQVGSKITPDQMQLMTPGKYIQNIPI